MSAGILGQSTVAIKKGGIKIGRPGYNITKIRDPTTGQIGLLFQLHYAEITEGDHPRVRFMSAFEQKIEVPDKSFQYFLVAAEPYEIVGFKIPAGEIDKREGSYFTWWDQDMKEFWCQFLFKVNPAELVISGPGMTGGN